MSLFKRGSKSKASSNLKGLLALMLGGITALVSLYVVVQAGARMPLSQVESLATIGLGLTVVLTILLFFMYRGGGTSDVQTRLQTAFFLDVADAVFIVNRFGRPITLNKAAVDFTPRSEDPLIDVLKAKALQEDETAPRIIEEMAGALSDLEPFEGQLVVLGQGGKIQRLAVSVTPQKRDDLSIVRLTDISAQTGVTRAGVSPLGVLTDYLPIGLYAVDGEGKTIAVNKTLAGWLDTTAEDITTAGQRIAQFIISSKRTEDRNETSEEVIFKSLTGEIFHGYLGHVEVEVGGQTHRGGLVLREDDAEGDWKMALRRSKLLFKRFFEEAPVGIVLVDLEGRITESNRIFRDLLGESKVGDLMSSCVEVENREVLSQKMAEAVSLGDTKEPVELTLMSDPRKVTSLYVGRMEDDQETAFGLMCHFIDVTEQKNLEQQFVQSQKMQAVGQLAGGIAHDFNNLLTAMIGYCDLLLERHRPGDPSFADINQIKQNANRAANLVRQLLAFSRQQRMNPTVLTLTDSLAELSNLITRLIGENIHLDIVHDRELWPVKVDQGQFEQVIINLAVNARDAMENKGDLSITTSNVIIEQPYQRGAEAMPPGEYVKIEVKDSGTGIPPDILERIFEPFFSTKDVGSGTGLGLSTVYGIIKQFNGYVYVDSVMGQGTAFIIYLPRHVVVEGAQKVISETKTIAGDIPAVEDLTGSEVILFAEDEDPVRMFTTRALKNKGYEVMAANSGESALQVLKEYGKPVDLLITDVMMPGMDGATFMSEVRKIQPDVRILCISGYSEDALSQKVDKLENVHFLSKPFSLKDIALKVRNIVSGKEKPISLEAIKEAEMGEGMSEETHAFVAAPPPDKATESQPAGAEQVHLEIPKIPETSETPKKQVSPKLARLSGDEKSSAPVPAAPPVPKAKPKKEAPAPPVPEAAPAEPPEEAPITILFAEDEDPVRMFTSRALENKGYKIIAGNCGEAALNAYKEHGKPVDMMITDVMMPGMDGPTLIDEMRKLQPGIKVLVISGYSEASLRERTQNDDSIKFLPKPFQLKEISRLVEDILAE